MSRRIQQLIDQDSVVARLLRGWAEPCACCGKLFRAGDEIIMPRHEAEALAAIGDVEILGKWQPRNSAGDDRAANTRGR
jgi:hypothetical protein